MFFTLWSVPYLTRQYRSSESLPAVPKFRWRPQDAVTSKDKLQPREVEVKFPHLATIYMIIRKSICSLVRPSRVSQVVNFSLSSAGQRDSDLLGAGYVATQR
jgi:hypothetical protein